ncbi:MAG: methyltransferase domain-containing protein [Alphaproteobacteria bacterium]|nr:methyltransferase domain-containing protein [Alphaproteobacteria bacterium]MBL7097464.1 methyltransferase domain-containing protein [Alphaproteobacteria bacterium]
MNVRYAFRRLLRPRGREAFLATLPTNARVLDVGCGSNSPADVKAQRPDLYYVGVDVSDYNHSVAPQTVADEYHVATPEGFADSIAALGKFDAVIWSHNLEHCNAPERMFDVVGGALGPGGALYLAWPAEHTVNLPSRGGCLNFFDDPTHREMPRFARVLERLREAGLKTTFESRAYKPLLPYALGGLLEPISRLTGRVAPLRSTWAFYGFESVVWFKRT